MHGPISRGLILSILVLSTSACAGTSIATCPRDFGSLNAHWMAYDFQPNRTDVKEFTPIREIYVWKHGLDLVAWGGEARGVPYAVDGTILKFRQEELFPEDLPGPIGGGMKLLRPYTQPNVEYEVDLGKSCGKRDQITVHIYRVDKNGYRSDIGTIKLRTPPKGTPV